jgi:hypothetical protein
MKVTEGRSVAYRGVARNQIWWSPSAAAANLRRLITLGLQLTKQGGRWPEGSTWRQPTPPPTGRGDRVVLSETLLFWSRAQTGLLSSLPGTAPAYEARELKPDLHQPGQSTGNGGTNARSTFRTHAPVDRALSGTYTLTVPRFKVRPYCGYHILR